MFLSDTHQLEVECFLSWAMILLKIFSQIIFVKLKALSSTNLEALLQLKGKGTHF